MSTLHQVPLGRGMVSVRGADADQGTDKHLGQLDLQHTQRALTHPGALERISAPPDAGTRCGAMQPAAGGVQATASMPCPIPNPKPQCQFFRQGVCDAACIGDASTRSPGRVAGL